MLQGDRGQVGDRRLRAERRGVEAGGEQRYRRVAGDQRAVAAAAEVVPPAAVDELEALGRRDEDVARGGVAFGLLIARRFATRSNAPASMIAGTATAIHSGWGRSLWVLESPRLK